MAGTCSNRAYKPGFHAISALEKYPKLGSIPVSK
jgi:hypothetical protein